MASQSFRLPWRVTLEDVVPLAALLFAEMGVPFEPTETELADGTHTHADAFGRSASWAYVTPEPGSFEDAMGGPDNVFAKIVVSPTVEIHFKLFASKLDAYTISGPREDVERIAAIMRRVLARQ